MKPDSSSDVLLYRIGTGLYVNVTAGCTASCTFCPRETRPVIHGVDLTLRSGHAAETYVAALEQAVASDRPSEVVLCGFGEPTLRLDVVTQVAARAKQLGLRVRLDTNGHGSLLHGRSILPELAGLIDALSVSLNAPDRESYDRIVQPSLPGAFEAVVGFIREAVRYIPDVTATAVAGLPGMDLAATEHLAHSLGARFRARPLDHLGLREETPGGGRTGA
jgi:TatD DNase family protein